MQTISLCDQSSHGTEDHISSEVCASIDSISTPVRPYLYVGLFIVTSSPPALAGDQLFAIFVDLGHYRPGMSSPKSASPSKIRTPSPSDEIAPTAGSSESQTTTSHIEADDSASDEGYAASTSTSYVSSIASDIRRGIEENGRLYAAYGQHKPWVPVDDAEVTRC